jgi:hypothetical protein
VLVDLENEGLERFGLGKLNFGEFMSSYVGLVEYTGILNVGKVKR